MTTIVAAVLLCVVIPLSLITWLLCLFANSHEDWHHRQDLTISPIKFAVAMLFPVVLAYKGVKSAKLNTSGAFAALVTGWVICFINYTFFVALLVFYLLGSKATKFRINQKTHERNVLAASARNWVQVVCNSFVALQLALFYYVDVGCAEKPVDFADSYNASWWTVGVLSAISCSCGDTLASELGPVLPFSQPYLIFSSKKVPKGTNGGISVAGTAASVLGGMMVGFAYFLSVVLIVRPHSLNYALTSQWPIIIVCGLAGLLGSLIDSFLGATLQYSAIAEDGCVVERPEPGARYISGTKILDNHSVNFFSTVFTSLIMQRLAFSIWYATLQWCQN